MNQRHLARVIGQIERLFNGSIATADDDDILAAEKETIAGGASRNAKTAKDLLARQAEPTRLRPGGDDHGVADIDVARIAGRDKRSPSQIERLDEVEDNPRADMLGLPLHLLHQPWALDNLGEAWVIFDIGCDRQLPARLQPGDEQRFEVGARRIDRRGIPGRTGAYDQDFAVVTFGHRRLPSVRRLLHYFTVQQL